MNTSNHNGLPAVGMFVTQLSQIIAVSKTVKGRADRDLTTVYHDFQKSEPLSGIARSYKPKDAEGQERPDESVRVQVDVETSLARIHNALRRMFDVQATLDWGNTVARADVVVDGVTVLAAVPVTYLLFLEKQLTHQSTVLRKLPTLSPAEEWTRDDNAGAWATAPIKSLSTTKVLRNHVVAEATDKHPAQVQVFQEDVVVGTWTTRKFSGALPVKRRQQLVDRVDALTLAVKAAREKANSEVVDDIRVADQIFDYLFAA